MAVVGGGSGGEVEGGFGVGDWVRGGRRVVASTVVLCEAQRRLGFVGEGFEFPI